MDPVELRVSTGIEVQKVQYVDLVRIVSAYVKERGDSATLVQRGVQLDRRLAPSKRLPRINRHSKIDLGGIKVAMAASKLIASG